MDTGEMEKIIDGMQATLNDYRDSVEELEATCEQAIKLAASLTTERDNLRELLIKIEEILVNNESEEVANKIRALLLNGSK